MAKKNNNFKYTLITWGIIIISIGISYLLWQDNSLYKDIINKKDIEIKELQEEKDLAYKNVDSLKDKLDEVIKEKDSISLEKGNSIHKIQEVEDKLDIEKEYGLVRLKDIDPSFVVDLRYATTNNFVGKQVYPDNSIAILRKDTGLKLKKANEIFQRDGYTIKILDSYRPLHVQYIFWDFIPNTNFVADPKKGSKHNRGAAVDLTLVDKNGNEIEMGTEFDNFTEKAAYNYPGHSETALKNMKYLRDVMVEVGFKGISNEWWHFDDVDWQQYDVLDIGFDEFE